MFDKELFLSLCNMYGVDMSSTNSSPMIRDRYGVHVIDTDDVRRLLSTENILQSSNHSQTIHVNEIFYLSDNFGIAC